MRLKYLKDDNNNDILQDDSGKHQVMMEWEKDYMIECINKLKPFGSVLEIGFGLGYSANAIINNDNVSEYTIIECSPEVWKKIDLFIEQYPNKKINVVKGRWEDVLYTCCNFDTIFFDDYSYNNDVYRVKRFIYDVLKDHTNIGSRIGVYSGMKTDYSYIKCIDYECDEYEVDIPTYCTYVNGDKMYIPIITKTSNDVEDFLSSQPNTIAKKPVLNYRHNMVVIDDFYCDINEVIKNKNDKLSDPAKEYIKKYLPDTNIKYFFDEKINILTKTHHPVLTTFPDNVWCGVIFLCGNAPSRTGLQFYKSKFNHRYYENMPLLDTFMTDIALWEKSDKIGVFMNRLVLFRGDMFHSFVNTYGDNINNALMFQSFKFSI